MLWTKIKRYLKLKLALLGEGFFSPSVKQILLRGEIRQLLDQARLLTPRNPMLYGYKVYSQTDEDGIVSEIFRRIGDGNRFFVEMGCGNGTENNSHFLLLKNWRGGWVDANGALIKHIAENIPLKSERLWVKQELVSVANVVSLVGSFMKWVDLDEIDFLSLDIDGNDLHVIQVLTKQIKPRVVSVEYNAKFPPPQVLAIAHNMNHVWSQDDYHGASLQAFVDALDGYRLVACSVSGANAFFVRADNAGQFEAYEVRQIYQPPRHYLAQLRVGPAPSLKYLRDLVQKDARAN